MLKPEHKEIFRGYLKGKVQPRYAELAMFILMGKSHREIAEIMGITEKSTKCYSGTIYRAFNVKNKHQFYCYMFHRLLDEYELHYKEKTVALPISVVIRSSN